MIETIATPPAKATRCPRREPVRTVDAAGNAIVRVPMPDGVHHATLAAADFDRITDAGYSDQWVFNDSGNGHRYVRVAGLRGSGPSMVNVHRLVMEAGPNEAVTFWTPDHLDLRPDNLRLQPVNRRPKGGKRYIKPDPSTPPVSRAFYTRRYR